MNNPTPEQQYSKKLIKQHIHLNDKVWSVGEYHAIQSSIIDATNTRDSHDDYIPTSETDKNLKWNFFNDVLQILNDKLNNHDT